jgi:hypothetical protein
MNVFDIINWVSSKGKRTYDGIKEPLISFFSSPTFSDSSEQIWRDSPQAMAQLLKFIHAFNKGDVVELLRFLGHHNMIDEYAFVLSYCVYIGVMNNWLAIPSQDKDTFQCLSMCLSYPLILQISSANLLNNLKSKSSSGNSHFTEIQNRINGLKNMIFDLRKTDFIEVLELENIRKKSEIGGFHSLSNHNNTLEAFFTGKFYEDNEAAVGNILQKTLNVTGSDSVGKIIDRLKEIYLFKPDFAHEDLENDPQKSGMSSTNLIKSAYKLRQHWENLKRFYINDAKTNARQDNDAIASKIISEAYNCSSMFAFMNVNAPELEQISSFIYPTMIYMFLYLKSLKDSINPNENGARMSILRQTLNFIWKLFTNIKIRHTPYQENSDKDPIALLGIKDKEKKIDFLNRYTGMIYNLKIKKSNIYILRDLLRFAIKFIFYRTENRLKEKRFDELINNLKLDSFMELYDYLEEMDNSKEVSENYKENIVNMFVQFVSDTRFKKHVSDIKNIVKLAQGDLTKLHYFVDKLFTKSETVLACLFRQVMSKTTFKTMLQLGKEIKLVRVMVQSSKMEAQKRNYTLCYHQKIETPCSKEHMKVKLPLVNSSCCSEVEL